MAEPGLNATNDSRRVAIVGAGAMGLAAAYHAAKRGHRVTVFEHDVIPGGMAAHFDFSGLSIERFYHFVCKSDAPTFELLDELGLTSAMQWSPTSMGYFVDGQLHDWGDPLSLLRFPGLGLVGKLRYGLLAAASMRRNDWRDLDKQTARQWITRWVGERVYAKLWEPLFAQKFYEYSENISAAWIWARLKRVGTSRSSVFQEELGYIAGGSETLIHALCAAVERCGGEIRLGEGASRIGIADGRVRFIETRSGEHPADDAICTIPTPYVSRLVPDLPRELRQRYDAIPNIGVVCVMFRLRRSVTPHFWVNISDARIGIPGIIEFSNLRPLPDAVIYVPYYMPTTNPKFGQSDADFVQESFGYLRLLNAGLTDSDVIATRVGRLRHAQPICAPGFLGTLPPIVTPIEGLQIADTCYYYPEDRSIAQSVRLGALMAGNIDSR